MAQSFQLCAHDEAHNAGDSGCGERTRTATLPTQQPKVPRAHQHRHFPSSSRGGVPRRVSEAAQVEPRRLLTGSLLLFLWWRSSTRAGLFGCSSTLGPSSGSQTNQKVADGNNHGLAASTPSFGGAPRAPPRNYKIFMVVRCCGVVARLLLPLALL